MASEAFLAALARVNLVAAVAVLAVLALRLPVARRFGAQAAYALWSLVPLAAAASLLPARRVVMLVTPAPASDPPPIVPEEVVGRITDVMLPPIDLAGVVLLAWAIGAAAWLGVLVYNQESFRRSLGAIRRDGGVFRAETADIGPAVVGVLRPRIILPADFEARFTPEEQVIVLAHERTHLRGGDHIVNALAALAQCAAWFNPLIHVAMLCLRIDQELACDAAVLARCPGERRRYAEAMLKAQLSPTHAPLACRWPGLGGHALKRRIAMLQAEPPTRSRRKVGVALVAGLSLGAVAVAWAAQPPQVEMKAMPMLVGDEATAAGSATAAADEASLARIAEARARANRRLARQDRANALSEIPDADVDRYIPGDGTPLIIAARRSDVVVARDLLARGADPNKAAPGDGNPLIVASAAGHKVIAQMLLDHGADINSFALGDETPLIAASRWQNPSMVRFLVERGADVNKKVPTGNYPGEMRSPLSVARDPQIIQYLRAHGATS